MEKHEALDYISSVLASRISDFHESAKKNPTLQENSNDAISKIYNAAEALEIRYDVATKVRQLYS